MRRRVRAWWRALMCRMGRHEWTGSAVHAGGEGTSMFDAEFVVTVPFCRCGAHEPVAAAQLAEYRAILARRTPPKSNGYR